MEIESAALGLEPKRTLGYCQSSADRPGFHDALVAHFLTRTAPKKTRD